VADLIVLFLKLDAEEKDPIWILSLVLLLGDGPERYFGSAFFHNCMYDCPELNTGESDFRFGRMLRTDALLSGQ
jgi:hypothetical protein